LVGLSRVLSRQIKAYMMEIKEFSLE